MGTLNLRSTTDPYERLYKIHDKILTLIRLHRPVTFAIEAPFFGKNVQSMLKLGRAQGVAIAAALQSGLPACEYSPRKVKKAITGNGNASKEQVSQMLQRMLDFVDPGRNFDATDAVAVAVCHHFQQQSGRLTTSDRSEDWKAFIKKHPEKVVK